MTGNFRFIFPDKKAMITLKGVVAWLLGFGPKAQVDLTTMQSMPFEE